jgi:L-iditol 2-dehydrogenase
MHAFPLTGLRAMELADTPDPGIRQPTDVLIRLGAVGVCGSDIHYYTTGRIGCQVVEYPFTVGHECAGTVEEVGSKVTLVRPGDRVAIEPAMHCGQCDQCRAGRTNTCRNNRFLGCPGQAEGCLSEFLVMPQQNCIRIADHISMAEATVSEPLAIGIYAVEQSGLPRGARIGILGLGPIGRTVLLPAMRAGCGPCYVTDKIDERCAAARGTGAAWVGNPLRQDVVAEILEQEPLGLDVVFECCGQQDALDQAIQLLRPGGKLLIVGIPEVDRVSFDPEMMRRKELTIINVRRQRDCVEKALQLIGENQEDIAALITHRFPFRDTKQAFDLVADYQDGVIKAMVEFTTEENH